MHIRVVDVTSVLTVVLLAGCTGPQVLPSTGDGHSQVSGAISVPDEFSGSSMEFCDYLDLRATALSGTRVGSAQVKSETSFCTYSIDGLPVATPLNLSIVSKSAFRCMRGASLVFNPDAVSITVNAGEAKAINFQATCAG